MTLPRSLIQSAFPNQPRMQQAFEALVTDAEDATARLSTALEAIGTLGEGAEGILSTLAAKQPKNATLDAISLLGPDAGVIEQVQAGSFNIRPIDAADVKSLVTRELGDSRWLGQNHQAASSGKWATPRNLTGSGDVSWSLTAVDGTANVNATTTLATVNSNTGTFGGAATVPQFSVNGKGLVTGVTAVPIVLPWTSVTGTPTTRAGYGITDAQASSALLTAYAGAAWSAGVQVPTLTAANTVALKTVGSATGNLLDKAAGDVLYLAIGGTAAAATKLATGRTIAMTGDVTWTSPAFDGTGNVTAAGTLATVNATTGSFGSATQVATFTVNGKGLTTAAANVTITPAVGSITGLGTGVATALAVNVGAAGAFITFNGAAGTPSSLTLTNATGLPVAGGGTGIASYTIGDLLQASASGTLAKLAAVATGNVLISGGVGVVSSWGKVGLTTHVSGTLPVANGGTGDTGTGWTAWTPTITPESGTITTMGAIACSYKQLGKTIWFDMDFTITTIGTAAGSLNTTLPATALNTRGAFAGVEVGAVGFSLAARLTSTTNLRIRKYDNSFLGANGYRYYISGCYEAA